MAVAFRSQTSIAYASHTNAVLTAPSGLADNDILIAIVFTAKQDAAPSVTAPAGFTQIGTEISVFDNGNFNGRTSIFWKRAASESGSYTFTHTTCSSQGLLMAFSGCITSGSPIDAASQNQSTDGVDQGSPSTASSITTTVANTLLLFLQQFWGDAAATFPTSFTERANLTILEAATNAWPTASATGSVTAGNGNFGTSSSGNPWSAYLIALKPPGSAAEIGRVHLHNIDDGIARPFKCTSGLHPITHGIIG